MSASYDYDLVVIGAGSGGVRAARMSASRGAKVATGKMEKGSQAPVVYPKSGTPRKKPSPNAGKTRGRRR